jgi:hypothetical protein
MDTIRTDTGVLCSNSSSILKLTISLALRFSQNVFLRSSQVEITRVAQSRRGCWTTAKAAKAVWLLGTNSLPEPIQTPEFRP